MPSRLPFANTTVDDAPTQETADDEPPPKRPRRSSLLRNLGGFLRRNHEQRDAEPELQRNVAEQTARDKYFATRRSSLPENIQYRRVIPSLPRPQTFRRQESEKREKLLEVPPSPNERRAFSLDRRRGNSVGSPLRQISHSLDRCVSVNAPNEEQESNERSDNSEKCDETASRPSRTHSDLPPLHIPDDTTCSDFRYPPCQEVNDDEDLDLASLQDEYDQRWILNISMSFRDKSSREKFFVTFAETPTKWRRLTISLDYRNAPEGSLEADLSTLHYQRDKSFRIYEAIRESLPEIQYYDTVTNLKLETTPDDCQLHVHVREDANEIINFPSIDLFAHVETRRYRESEIEFVSHLSGFVYKVLANGKVMIKKEIPGPDTVDEFLYEVNALEALIESRGVVDLEGLVTDEDGSVVKGLLIAYASQGALVDILYDCRHDGNDLPWSRRERWARQIVGGLSDVHEAGFVQGDFTLANIVVDEIDDAMIIDVNRRGCPVGWEPPELSRLIDSGQRIGMCIGVKTDMFQLGMVLWALACMVDDPEREDRPLEPLPDHIPQYYRDIVTWCLSERPQGRKTAKECLQHFPPVVGRAQSLRGRSVDFADDVDLMDNGISTEDPPFYTNPEYTVTLDDVNPPRGRRRSNCDRAVPPFSAEQVTYFDPRDPASNPPSTSARFDSSEYWIDAPRGRTSTTYSRTRRMSSPFARKASSSSATSLSRSRSRSRSRSPPSRSRRRCGSESSTEERSRSVGEVTRKSTCPTEVDECEGGVALTPVRDVEAVEGLAEGGEPAAELPQLDAGLDEMAMDGAATVGEDSTAAPPAVENSVPVHDEPTKPSSIADLSPSNGGVDELATAVADLSTESTPPSGDNSRDSAAEMAQPTHSELTEPSYIVGTASIDVAVGELAAAVAGFPTEPALPSAGISSGSAAEVTAPTHKKLPEPFLLASSSSKDVTVDGPEPAVEGPNTEPTSSPGGISNDTPAETALPAQEELTEPSSITGLSSTDGAVDQLANAVARLNVDPDPSSKGDILQSYKPLDVFAEPQAGLQDLVTLAAAGEMSKNEPHPLNEHERVGTEIAGPMALETTNNNEWSEWSSGNEHQESRQGYWHG